MTTRKKWKLVLGGQYGCVYIDEVNTADIEFVRELSTRNDYLMATLNPDNPRLTRLTKNLLTRHDRIKSTQVMCRKKLCETYQNQLTLNGVTGFYV